jgi:hypothetical protein
MKTLPQKTNERISNRRMNFSSSFPFLAKSFFGILLFFGFSLLTSCEKDPFGPDNKPESIIPDRFMVAIPQSISSSSTLKSLQIDTLSGNTIYQHLRTFISVGEYGADMAQNIMLSIATLNLNRPLELTFNSDEDGRPKHLKIVENVMFENANWQYRLTITDAGSANEPGQTAHGLQVFWSWNPLIGIAIVNPFNINRNIEEQFANTRFRIDYSEAGNLGYEAHMLVSITGLPLPNPLQNPFGLDKMKMFAGRNGNMVTVYGNSQHPNARFFSNETGFNWAFVAAAFDNQDIAIAEVGLPPMGLDASDRETLLETYSIYNVLRDQVLNVWPTIDPAVLNAYLHNTMAPGYFDHTGFIQAATAPSEAYLPLKEQIQQLTPYNPQNISNLTVVFGE